MWKNIFILFFGLITEPTKKWDNLAEKNEKDNENFYKNYLHPVFGIIALFAFVGALFETGKFDMQIAMKAVIKQIAVYFGSFYLSLFIMSEFVMPRFKNDHKKLLTERFIGYASVLVYLVAMLRSLSPSMSPLLLIVFYSVYIIWVGAVRYLKMREEYLIKFTVVASIILLLLPISLEQLINLLMPGMKI
ncbi:MAG: YIP1 family protein [Dysgonamonadaceae bacterium]|jgi:hypothetical protein|nr:YIP1 family protein [Dysgonamonadaceae bacterium]